MTTPIPQSHAALALRQMPHPADPQQQVSMFGDWQRACEHLRDHLLTAPECHAWPLVIPDLAAVVDPGDPDRRWQYARQAWQSQGAAAQPLYELYCDAIRGDARDASQLRWLQSDQAVTVGLGTSGILILIEGGLRTAFLPGQGDPEQTRTARSATGPAAESGGALPRERGMRSGRPGRRARGHAEKRQRGQAERESQWSDAQRLYKRVFRPAVQFIRSCYKHCCDGQGNWIRRDYALLKDVLPRRSQLKFEHWKQFRAQCGRA